MLSDEEIKKKVYERYPKCEEERHCNRLRQTLTELRNIYFNKLEQSRNDTETHSQGQAVGNDIPSEGL